MKRALKINEDFFHSKHLLGQIYLNTGKYKKALDIFEKLVTNSVDRFQKAGAYNMLARTHLKLGNQNEVLEFYHKSLNENILNFVAIEIMNLVH